jgi:hypothetical protein
MRDLTGQLPDQNEEIKGRIDGVEAYLKRVIMLKRLSCLPSLEILST